MKILPRINESYPIKSEFVPIASFNSLSHQFLLILINTDENITNN